MADFSPFPDLLVEDIQSYANLDPELEQSRAFANVREPIPYGMTYRIDFAKGDLDVSPSGRVPVLRGQASLAQWAMQTCLTERFESPLLSGDIGLEIRDKHIGEILTPARMSQIASQIPVALKAHDRITKVFVQRVFSIGSTLYLFVRYETDDSESQQVVVGLGVAA